MSDCQLTTAAMTLASLLPPPVSPPTVAAAAAAENFVRCLLYWRWRRSDVSC